MGAFAKLLPADRKEQIFKAAAARGWVRVAVPQNFDESFRPVWQTSREFTMTTIERGYALHQAVRYAAGNSLPGVFVECGVWRGGSSMIAALTAQQIGWNPQFFMFDTYAGMTKPDTNDGARAMHGWQENEREDHNEWAYTSLEDVRANMLSTGLPAERLTMVKGPVEETIPHEDLEQIALLRLDTDWYASTKHELEHLYDKLVPGGVLILDDYGDWEGARRAVDEFFAARPAPLLTRVDSTGRVAIKTN